MAKSFDPDLVQRSFQRYAATMGAAADLRMGPTGKLLLDPALPDIAQIDQTEGNPTGTLSSRIRAALGRFQEIAESCGPRMRVRTYQAAPSVSIVRGDDRMFVTPYMRHLIGRSSPTHELRRAVDGGAFDRYAEHVDNIWTTAKEHTP